MLEITLNPDSGELMISEEARRVLRRQTITEHQPGTILRDAESLLSFVGDQPLATSGKHLFFPQSKLDELNALTSHPAPQRLKRPQQRSLPNLHGLYLLLRCSGLLAAAGAPGAGRLTVDKQMLQSWRALNAAERYFALLESWLVRGGPDVLGEPSTRNYVCFEWLISVAQRLWGRRIVEDPRDCDIFYNTANLVTGSLMEMFGWVKLEYAEPAAGEGVRIASVERLPLGDAMVSALDICYLECISQRPPSGRDDAPNPLRDFFQPFFPDYQRSLAPPQTAFRDGSYTFRVSLHRAMRRILAPADLSLEALAMAILDSVGFDDDHLYCFEVRGADGRIMRIACPYENDADYFADELALGDLPLPVNGSMTMIFDYGDGWRFNITLEKVEPPDAALTEPRIIAKRGRPPKQYEWNDME